MNFSEEGHTCAKKKHRSQEIDGEEDRKPDGKTRVKDKSGAEGVDVMDN